MSDRDFFNFIMLPLGIVTFFVLLMCVGMWNIDRRLQRNQAIIERMIATASKMVANNKR